MDSTRASQGREEMKMGLSIFKSKSSKSAEQTDAQEVISKLQGEIKTLQEELASLRNQMQTSPPIEESTESSASADCENCKILSEQLDAFQSKQHCFQQYEALSPQLKENLSSVYLEDTYENFIACSAQKETVDALWMLGKTLIFQGDLSQIETIEELFQFAIHCHNSTSKTQIFHLVDGIEGGEFDTDCHISTPDSKKAGEIQRCLLPGYALGKDKKIKQKAIVVVG